MKNERENEIRERDGARRYRDPCEPRPQQGAGLRSVQGRHLDDRRLRVGTARHRRHPGRVPAGNEILDFKKGE